MLPYTRCETATTVHRESGSCSFLKPYQETACECALPEAESLSEADTLRQLEAFLKPRIEEAERGEVTGKSVGQIFEEVRAAPRS